MTLTQPPALKAQRGFAGPKVARWIAWFALGGMLLGCIFFVVRPRPASSRKPPVRTYLTRGIVRRIDPGDKQITIAHEDIPAYMPAMTMPFRVRVSDELNGLQAGDSISFCLSVTDAESWVDHIARLPSTVKALAVAASPPNTAAVGRARHPLLDYAFTNELGQPVRLRSFDGQVLAITFFFTRCPIPEFCPRLSRNFAEASQRLHQLADGPTNWHFLSISFDPDYDTPPVLHAYAETYHYDPRHWSFLTGPKDRVAELAHLCDVKAEPDGALFNHDFRTLIIDAAGQVQMVFPVGGDLSDAIVAEVVKARRVSRNKAS